MESSRQENGEGFQRKLENSEDRQRQWRRWWRYPAAFRLPYTRRWEVLHTGERGMPAGPKEEDFGCTLPSTDEINLLQPSGSRAFLLYRSEESFWLKFKQMRLLKQIFSLFLSTDEIISRAQY